MGYHEDRQIDCQQGQYCALRKQPCALAAGKNRPLDEEELHFIDAVEQQQRLKDQSVREEEAAALDAYQQVGCWPVFK